MNTFPRRNIVVNLRILGGILYFDDFKIKMNQTITSIFESLDNLWIQRKRTIDTMKVVTAVHKSAITNRGLSHVLKLNSAPFSAAALCKARQKIPQDCFRKVICEFSHVKDSERVFAVDGSKVHLPVSFLKQGFTTRTNNKPVSRPAQRPLAMLTSVVDVRSKIAVDYSFTSHFNERKAFLSILQNNSFLKAGDIFLFDRGYFSSKLINVLSSQNMNFIFRLKRDAFKGAKQFFNSRDTSRKVLIGEYPAMLVKYFIDGKKYMCLTSTNVAVNQVKKLYKERWRVEEHFKRLKSYLGIEKIATTSLHSFLQDIDIRLFLDWLTLHCKKTATSTKSQVAVLDSLEDHFGWSLGYQCQVRQNLYSQLKSLLRRFSLTATTFVIKIHS